MGEARPCALRLQQGELRCPVLCPTHFSIVVVLQNRNSLEMLVAIESRLLSKLLWLSRLRSTLEGL